MCFPHPKALLRVEQTDWALSWTFVQRILAAGCYSWQLSRVLWAQPALPCEKVTLTKWPPPRHPELHKMIYRVIPWGLFGTSCNFVSQSKEGLLVHLPVKSGRWVAVQIGSSAPPHRLKPLPKILDKLVGTLAVFSHTESRQLIAVPGSSLGCYGFGVPHLSEVMPL